MVAAKRMDGSQVTKKAFQEWLEEAATQSNAAFESAHVDELEGLPLSDEAGVELVQRSCALLEEGRAVLQNVQGARPLRYLLMFLPLAPTSTLSLWEEEAWNKVTGADEPLTVYLIAGDQLFEEWDEEYRRPVQVPVAEHSGCRAIYRCWRTSDDMQRSWEFARGVYIIVDLLRETPLSEG
jgi:hypothetical protein